MEQTIYLIQDKETKKYFNISYNYFTNQMFLATPHKSKKEMQRCLTKLNFVNCEVIESTEFAFMGSMAGKTVEIVMTSDILIRKLDEVKHFLPTISNLNKSLSVFLKNTSEKLKHVTGEQFKEFEKTNELTTYGYGSNYDEYILELSKVEVWEFAEVVEILKARRKSRESIIGIARKINKHKKN